MNATSCDLSWTSHPLRDEDRWKSAALIAAILGFSGVVYHSLESLAYALTACAVLVAALSRYFLPVHYCLTEREVAVTHAGMTRRMPWDRFKSLYVRETEPPGGIPGVLPPVQTQPG
jgi:hypothetical protein